MRTWLRVILVLISAVCVPLCLPPYGWWPLFLISLFTLFTATRHATTRLAGRLGMLQGVLAYGFSLYWFFNIFGFLAISLYTILGLFTALYCFLYGVLEKQTRSPHARVLLAATLWTAIEFYRSELFVLSFPWVTPGTALGPTFLSPILGVYGASFFVVASVSALTQRKTVPLGVALALGVVCLGTFRPGRIDPKGNETIGVTVVQSEDCFLGSYTALSRKASREDTDLLIWPEYSLPYDVRKSAAQFKKLKELCREMDAVLVLGTKTIVGPGAREWHNTALVLDESGVLGEYYKARPVHFFDDGIPGRRFDPIKTEIGSIATPICFDCDYSQVLRKMTDLGAEFFAVPSFDAKSWSTTQHLQHAALFRIRAAENARWLACAASSGVSQIIDPHGNVHAEIPPMVQGFTSYRIQRQKFKTAYTRFGWLFPWGALVAAVAMTISAGLRRFTRRSSHPQV